MMYKEYIVPLREEENDCGLMINAVIRVQPELIRCMDCKFRYTDGESVTANYCELNHNRVMADDWFCADAERKEE